MPIIGPGSGGAGGDVHHPFTPTTMIFTVSLPNFPEWAIPMTKVIPRVYLDDAYYDPTIFPSIEFDVSCQHFWTVIQNQDNLGNPLPPSISLKVIVHAYASQSNGIESPPIAIPTYLDIDMVFLNENVWNEISVNKS